jgi:hypothetical protein
MTLVVTCARGGGGGGGGGCSWYHLPLWGQGCGHRAQQLASLEVKHARGLIKPLVLLLNESLQVDKLNNSLALLYTAMTLVPQALFVCLYICVLFFHIIFNVYIRTYKIHT